MHGMVQSYCRHERRKKNKHTHSTYLRNRERNLTHQPKRRQPRFRAAERDPAARRGRGRGGPAGPLHGPVGTCQFLAKFRQNVARFRLYRHRFLQENMRFAAFFKIYQIIKLKFLKFGKFCKFCDICKFFAEFSQKLLIFFSARIFEPTFS